MDIVFKIVDDVHDKTGLQFVCKSFQKRYHHLVRHKQGMRDIRNTLCLEYLKRKYIECGSIGELEFFIVTHPECQEHARVIHRWYDMKYPTGLFIRNINWIIGNTTELTEEVYRSYLTAQQQ